MRIDYTNWRGERRWRVVTPLPMGALRFETNRWHGPAPQWIMYALDEEIGETRGFAMNNIHKLEKIDEA